MAQAFSAKRPVRRRHFLGAAGALTLGSLAVLGHAQAQPRVVEVLAKRFVFVPNEIRVKKGETVLLQFTSDDVPMGFALADFKAQVDIVPGKVATLLLTPEKLGNFTFLCDVFCGSGHEEMDGSLIVTE